MTIDGEAADTGRFAFPLVLRGTTALSYVNSQTFPPGGYGVEGAGGGARRKSVTVDFGQTYAINGDGTLATFAEQVDGPIVAPLTAQNGAALDVPPITGDLQISREGEGSLDWRPS